MQPSFCIADGNSCRSCHLVALLKHLTRRYTSETTSLAYSIVVLRQEYALYMCAFARRPEYLLAMLYFTKREELHAGTSVGFCTPISTEGVVGFCSLISTEGVVAWSSHGEGG